MNDGDFPRRARQADYDLLALPGMARPAHRSHRDDDPRHVARCLSRNQWTSAEITHRHEKCLEYAILVDFYY
jgi:GT2 family glycosyltransferase